MTVTPEEYLDKLVDMCQFKISCMVQVVETKQFHCESDVFRLVKPDIEITVLIQSQDTSYNIKQHPKYQFTFWATNKYKQIYSTNRKKQI